MQKPKSHAVRFDDRQIELAARGLMARLAELGSPERAAQERAYLRSDMEFLGVTVPQSRKAVKELLASLPGIDRAVVVALAEALWREPVFEGRRCAVELLVLRSALLGGDDLGLVERLLRDSHTWALVDTLAVHVAGVVFQRQPGAAGAVLDRWAQDADFWIRRSAVLALLPGVRAGAADLGRFGQYADAMLEEKEFFIRKAIGWTLREISLRDPDFVIRWTTARVARMSGVTLREAVRRLPEGERETLMEAYRAR